MPRPDPPRESLSRAQARRVAIAAQGLGSPAALAPPAARGRGPLTARQVPAALDRVLDRVAVLQVDSVNVLARSHYLPVFARIGPYSRADLDRAANEPPRRMVEYWAHMASFTAPAVHALLGHRMARAGEEVWGGVRRAVAEHPDLLDVVRDVVTAAGPMTCAEIETALGGRRPVDRVEWGWNWTQTKYAVEYLFHSGVLASAGRTAQFERRYDLPARVAEGLADGARPEASPASDEAVRDLVAIAARAQGVATVACLRDYFRLRADEVRVAVGELVEAQRLVPVRVEGWRDVAYLHPDAALPARVSGRALLSPFDSLIWFRPRTEALFDVRYRIEIYTPAAKRVHGYYVLPYLLGDRIVARVDLKADRAVGALRVQSAWLEPEPVRGGRSAGEVAAALAVDLGVMAEWLGLAEVAVAGRGDLSDLLAAALRPDLG